MTYDETRWMSALIELIAVLAAVAFAMARAAA